MASLRTSPMCGTHMIKGERSVVQSSSSSGWRVHFSSNLKPEVVWCRQGTLKQGKVSTLRLVVTASTKGSQNVDLPPILPKRKKRPSLLPKQSRRRKVPDLWEDPSLQPPANGLLVENLIPVAYEVMEAKGIVTEGVRRLMEELPVFACRYCSEAHVGPVGHNLRSCTGTQSSSRNSGHAWVKATIEDILVPLDAYHLADRLAKPVSHEERFDVERIPVIDELCIQAGVDDPEHPTKRNTEPIEPLTRKKKRDAAWLGGVQFTFYTSEGSYLYTEPSKHLPPKYKSKVALDHVIDTEFYDSEDPQRVSNDPPGGGTLKNSNRLGTDIAVDTQIDDERDLQPSERAGMDEHRSDNRSERARKAYREPLVDISSEDDLVIVAQKTLQAWERLREGCKKLLVRYRVMACGYCAEVHVGPRGHRARNCGEFKHQWRDGKHGWQDASIDDVVPPQHVWHLRDRLGPPLENPMRRYYGKAPAVVELCVQAGAPIPENHAPLMRLDVAIPTLEEVQNVV